MSSLNFPTVKERQNFRLFRSVNFADSIGIDIKLTNLSGNEGGMWKMIVCISLLLIKRRHFIFTLRLREDHQLIRLQNSVRDKTWSAGSEINHLLLHLNNLV